MGGVGGEPFEFGEGVFQAGQGFVEDSRELSEFVVRVGNWQSLTERLGSNLPRLLGYCGDGHQRPSRDEVAAQSCQQNRERRCQHEDFDNLPQRAAHVGFIAEQTHDDPELMHTGWTLHDPNVKVILQLKGVESERRFDRRGGRVPDVGIPNGPVAKQQLPVF